MSAGAPNGKGILTDKQILEQRCNDVTVLPLIVQARLKGFLAAMAAAGQETFVFETGRNAILQADYYAIGSSHAKTRFTSWHGYDLAADCLKKGLEDPWGASSSYWNLFQQTAKKFGFSWGGDWHSFPDKPHIQPHELPASPTPEDVALIEAHGKERVWAKYGFVPVAPVVKPVVV